MTRLRRLRWVVLALVPSSLMLGATTYITTDVAAIPLLWVLPLALYLLSFIIVFARTPPRVQQAVVWLGLAALLVAVPSLLVPAVTENEGLRAAACEKILACRSGCQCSTATTTC